MLANPAFAGHSGDIYDKSGKALAIALPIVAAGISTYKDDWNGVAQLAVVTGLTVGTAYGLKQFVREGRPDHSDDKSFPSDTAALAYAPADYLWRRYGWQYGVPAYAVAMFVGYSRVEAKQHHWYDVLASSGMALTYNLLFTRRYHPPRNFYASVSADSHGGYFSMSYRF